MNYDDQKLTVLAASFGSRDALSKNSSQFQEVIRLGLGVVFFQKTMDYLNASFSSREIAITEFMSCLEDMAQKNRSIAIYLMTKLWKSAGSMYMHHICDSIDLWVDNEKDTDTIEFIKISATENKNSDMEWKYSEWLSS